MFGIYFVGTCHDVEAGNDHLAVPDDRFSRLVQTAVATVAIRTLGNTLNAAVFLKTGYINLRKIGNTHI